MSSITILNVMPQFGASICGLYYKPIAIINDDSSVVNMLETSDTDDARVVIYVCHRFIVQATDFIIYNCNMFILQATG